MKPRSKRFLNVSNLLVLAAPIALSHSFETKDHLNKNGDSFCSDFDTKTPSVKASAEKTKPLRLDRKWYLNMHQLKPSKRIQEQINRVYTSSNLWHQPDQKHSDQFGFLKSQTPRTKVSQLIHKFQKSDQVEHKAPAAKEIIAEPKEARRVRFSDVVYYDLSNEIPPSRRAMNTKVDQNKIASTKGSVIDNPADVPLSITSILKKPIAEPRLNTGSGSRVSKKQIIKPTTPPPSLNHEVKLEGKQVNSKGTGGSNVGSKISRIPLSRKRLCSLASSQIPLKRSIRISCA